MAASVRAHLRRNVVAYLALFVALGGTTAWAADKITSKQIAKKAVRAKHIKAGQVKNPKLADGAVTSAKVAQGSLEAGDFAAGQLPQGERGMQGEQGPQGERGPEGARGPQGVAGTARAYATVIPHTADACDPTCTISRGKGVAAVTRAGVGIYCVNAPGIDASQVSAAATVDWNTTPNPEGNASAMTALGLGCATSRFTVVTHRQSPTDVRNAADNGDISVAGNSEPFDRVGFTIAIP